MTINTVETKNTPKNVFKFFETCFFVKASVYVLLIPVFLAFLNTRLW